MEIEFVKANFSKTKPKATIHMTGKLGFNTEASNLMDLSNKGSFLIGKDKNNEDKLYLLESDSEGSVKIAKAGEYYYLNAGNVFELMELDYRLFTIMFDVSLDKYNDKDIYVLNKRIPKPRNIKNA